MENKLQALIHNKNFDLKKCQFDLTPHFNGKPKKALWTSTYIDEESISSWYIWCREEDFELKDCLYLVKPKSNIKVIELNTVEDLFDLPVVKAFNRDCLDFERIAKKGYCGISLSKEGLKSINDLAIYHLNSVVSSFWGWDCESTVWFNTDWIERIWLEENGLIRKSKKVRKGKDSLNKREKKGRLINMDLLANTYDKDSIAFTLVESINELILKYGLENKKISDKNNREEFKDIQFNLETYGNRVVKGKLIMLLSAKTNSSYENNLKKLRDSIVRMLSDNNQLANKYKR